MTKPNLLLCLIYLLSFVWGQAQTDATGLSKLKLKVAPEDIPTQVKWKLAPFLKAHSIEYFDALDKQVYFKDYDPKSRKLRMGVANFQGNILVPPEKYEYIYNSKNMFWMMFDLDNGVMALKTKPDSTFAYPFYNPYTRDTIVVDEKTIIKQVSANSFQFLINGKLVRSFTGHINTPRDDDDYIHVNEGVHSEYTLNKSGNVMIPKGRFSAIFTFKNGYSTLAILDEKNEWVLIDTKGKIIPTPAGVELRPLNFSKDKLFTFSTDKGYPQIKGLINQHGQVIVKPSFEAFESDFVHLFAGQVKDHWWLYNFQAEKIMPDTFDHVQFNESYFVTVSNAKKKINVYDVQLKLQHSFDFDGYWDTPYLYLSAETKQPYVGITNTYGTSNLYDMQGHAYTDEQSQMQDFIAGGVIYTKMRKYGLNALGKKQHLPPIFDKIFYLEESKTLWGKIDGKWGLLDW